VPSGSRWLHEIKFNGYRVQAHLHHEEVRIYTRRDYTDLETVITDTMKFSS
jgi:bifunctional non-homologous end joining protein LigD